MRQWDGIRDDLSDAGGEGLHDAIGVSFSTDGELGRRTGLTRLAAVGGMAMGAFHDSQGNSWLMLVTTSGAVMAQAL